MNSATQQGPQSFTVHCLLVELEQSGTLAEFLAFSNQQRDNIVRPDSDTLGVA